MKKIILLCFLLILTVSANGQDSLTISNDLLARVARVGLANQVYLHADDFDSLWHWMKEMTIVRSDQGKEDVKRVLTALGVVLADKKEGVKQLNRQQFEPHYQQKLAEIAHFRDVQFKEFVKIGKAFLEWYRLQAAEDPPFSQIYPSPLPDFVVLSQQNREELKNTITNLSTYLEQIGQANSADSTLIYANTKIPEITENFWGNTFVEMESDVIIRNIEKDTIATIHIDRLKAHAIWTIPFWKIRYKALLFGFYDTDHDNFDRDVGGAISSLNWRKFDLNIFAATQFWGGGIGYSLTRNFGPVLGLGASYDGSITALLGIFFSFN